MNGKRRRMFLQVVLCACFCSCAAQGVSAIHLKPGIYVAAGTACKDAPFAAMSRWDGVGFGGPHDSRCRTEVLRHEGNSFDVSTTCSALGDGTPTRPTTFKARLTIVNEESYSTEPLIETMGSSTETKPVIYRWCSAK